MSLNLDNGAATAAPTQQRKGPSIVAVVKAVERKLWDTARRAIVNCGDRCNRMLTKNPDFICEHQRLWRSTGPSGPDEQNTVMWGNTIVAAILDGDVAHPPVHMSREDLAQEIWVGLTRALKSYNPQRGPILPWVIRHGIQRAYDVVRWADKHGEELYAVPTDDEICQRLESFAHPGEETLVAATRARLLAKASAVARLVFAEFVDGFIGEFDPIPRLTAVGIGDRQIDRALTELRSIVGGEMRNSIYATSFVQTCRRARDEARASRKP